MNTVQEWAGVMLMAATEVVSVERLYAGYADWCAATGHVPAERAAFVETMFSLFLMTGDRSGFLCRFREARRG